MIKPLDVDRTLLNRLRIGAANNYLRASNTNRFLALLSTTILPAFPFAFAPEVLIATGGEMRSPRRKLPTAARRYI